MAEPLKKVVEFEGTGFPSTRLSVLKRAASNEWQGFVSAYARVCWNELLIQCRQRSIPLAEADDLFQEFFLRLLKPATARASDPEFRGGNLAERFLARLPEQETPAMFRTFLKATIANILREFLRERAKNHHLPLVDDVACEAAIEHSVSKHAEGIWLAQRLGAAVAAFREESENARTKGKQREFALLYGDIVDRLPAEALGERLGLARSTVAELLPQARSSFRRHLKEATGINDSVELKALLQQHAAALVAAFQAFPVPAGNAKS